jgi:hypothetical protein
VDDPSPLPLLHVGLGTTDVGAPISWQLPGLEIPQAGAFELDFDGGWGWIRDGGVVEVATTAGSTQLETVFSSLAYQLRPVARGQLVAWCDFSDWSPTHRARVRSWTKAGGTAALVSGPYDIMAVALSDTKMVWLGASGLGAIDGTFETSQLFWSPVVTSPQEVAIHDGPVVPHGHGSVGWLATYGDRAACVVKHDTAELVVANLVTGDTWLLPSRPGRHFLEVQAMNETSVLLTEYATGNSLTFPDRLVRLDLSALDQLVLGQWH